MESIPGHDDADAPQDRPHTRPDSFEPDAPARPDASGTPARPDASGTPAEPGASDVTARPGEDQTPDSNASRAPVPADLDLPRAPGRMRRWLDRHPRLVDWTLVVVCQVVPFAGVLVSSAMGAVGGWAIVGVAALVVVAASAMLLRRRRPVLAALVVTAVALLPVPYSIGGSIGVFVALYSLGIYTTVRRTWIVYAITAAGAAISTAAQFPSIVGTPDEVPAVVASGSSLIVVYLVPVLMGLSVGNRRRYLEALIDRAHDLARERDQRALLAAAEERARIAREMHDIVSHGLTVMVTLSEGAAAQAEAGSDQAPAVMRRVADTGRSALAEMRRLLGVLREPGAAAEREPLPDKGEFSALVDRFRDAGLEVRWTQQGPPIEESGQQLATYRIVQEALTNVLRHAPGAEASATVQNLADRILITVEDRGGRTSSSSAGAGRGIIGMRERAAVHDGAVEAGPYGSGWRLRAELRKDAG